MNADHTLPLLDGRVLDLRKPWPLTTPTDELLQRAAEKAAPRRFTGEPLTGFGSFEEDCECSASASLAAAQEDRPC